MDHFQLQERRTPRRGRAARAHCRGGGHARLRLFARHARTPRARVPRGPVRARAEAAHRLCREVQSQHCRAQGAAAAGLRRRRGLGRRDWSVRWPRACRQRTSCFPASARPTREMCRGSTQGSASSTSRARKRAASSPNRRRARGSRRRRTARQSRCRCEDSRQDLDRQGGEQVRRPDDRAPRRSSASLPRCDGLNLRGLAVHIGSQLAGPRTAGSGLRQGRRAGERPARAGPYHHPRRSGRRAWACPTRRTKTLPSSGRIRRDGRARDRRAGACTSCSSRAG